MFELQGRHLALLIRTVDDAIHDLCNLPEERIVPDDQVRLLDLENLAEGLEELYKAASATEDCLPPYEKLVRPK
ncbi:MAG: hypothetical protein LBE82_10515 [Chitinophagaceae bacterium]|jgi:hypothetical protein|nr:hypothetical protein [Chitinophagaceae bacterium]